MNFLQQFFNTLNSQNIQYCVLRNYQSLPESTGGSDLDILINKKDVTKFMFLLETFIETSKLHLISVISDKQCPKYCISNVNWGLQMDVFKGSVHFGKRELFSASILFNNTINYKGVQVLNPKVGVVLAFLKELLNNKTCNKKYIIELQNQFENQEIEEQLLGQFKPQFHEYLNQHLNQFGNEHLLELYRMTKDDFHRSKMTGFNNKLNRLFRQPGYTIAFLGTGRIRKKHYHRKYKTGIKRCFSQRSV